MLGSDLDVSGKSYAVKPNNPSGWPLQLRAKRSLGRGKKGWFCRTFAPPSCMYIRCENTGVLFQEARKSFNLVLPRVDLSGANTPALRLGQLGQPNPAQPNGSTVRLAETNRPQKPCSLLYLDAKSAQMVARWVPMTDR
jgi:hypothetical protein